MQQQHNEELRALVQKQHDQELSARVQQQHNATQQHNARTQDCKVIHASSHGLPAVASSGPTLSAGVVSPILTHHLPTDVFTNKPLLIPSRCRQGLRRCVRLKVQFKPAPQQSGAGGSGGCWRMDVVLSLEFSQEELKALWEQQQQTQRQQQPQQTPTQARLSVCLRACELA